MSAAGGSVRSYSNAGDVLSSRRPTDEHANWGGEGLQLNDGLEAEASGGSLPRTVSREASRTAGRPASTLSNHGAPSNIGGTWSRRSSEPKNPVIGTVQPWYDADDGGGPEPAEPEGGFGGGGGGSPPHALSREHSKTSAREPRASEAPSHRSAGGASSVQAPPAGGPAERRGLPEDGGRAQGPQAEESQFPEGGYEPIIDDDEEEGAPGAAGGAGGQPELGSGPDGPGAGPGEGTPRQGSESGGYAQNSERGSRRPSALGMPKPPEASGAAGPGGGSAAAPSPRPPSGSRDGSKPPSGRAASGLSHHTATGGGGGGSGRSRRPSAVPVEMQELPPEALPWSEPDFPSRVPSAVSVVADSKPVLAAPVGPAVPSGMLPHEPGQESLQRHTSAAATTTRTTTTTTTMTMTMATATATAVASASATAMASAATATATATAAATSNRSVGQRSGGGHRPPVEVPLLPLRDLANGRSSGPASVSPPDGYPPVMEPAPPAAPSPTPPAAPSPTPPTAPSPTPPAAPSPTPPAAPSPTPPPCVGPEDVPGTLSREGSRTSFRPASVAVSIRSQGHKSAATSHRSALDIPSHPLTDGDFGSPAGTQWGGGGHVMYEPQPGYESPRLTCPSSRGGSRASMRPSSANSANKTPFATKSATEWHSFLIEPLPWSARALSDFKSQMKKTAFVLPDPTEEPLTARLDAVFALPHDLWPVLPPGGLYCLEACDPRSTFTYLQHGDFPDTKVRVNTYFGKWGRHLVDYVVAWQPIPRAEAAWQLGDAKQPPQPWEPRQVVAHTTNGEYQYANTRMKFRGPRSTKPDAEVVDYSDAHGVDLLDTKAAHESAPRNSDKDRDAHLIDPPRPNTWGELARRPLISNLRAHGGGTYVHHVNYDHSGLRTTCGRRVPAGYYFTLIPNAAPKAPPVPGHRERSSSVGRSMAGGLRSGAEPSNLRMRSVNSPVQALLSTFGDSVSSSKWGAYVGGIGGGPSTLSVGVTGGGLSARPSSAGPRRGGGGGMASEASRLPQLGTAISAIGAADLGAMRSAWSSVSGGGYGAASAAAPTREGSRLAAPTSPTLVALTRKQRWRTYDVPFDHPLHSARAQELGADAAVASGRNVRTFSDAAAVLQVAEQELRMSRAFVPGPLVVPTWEDIPRLYVEHMEAARALMPVTELDTYGTSRLHQLIYHLQCAATLEYDRLDAKLLLLPQMARLGKKSAEIDAWLQVIVEHAAYLYDKLEITDRARWRPVQPDRAPPMRRSVTFAKASALVNPTSSTWNFPDPLVGTSFAHRSALNVAVQAPPPPPVAALPAHCVTTEEWAAITKIMDTCRHAILHDHWVRLRPVMTGSTLPGGSYSSSRAGSMIAASSDAGATASGEGDRLHDANDMYGHGSVNRELLDYVHKDLEIMSAPDFAPQPPPPASLPKHRGYRGEGPLPPDLVADMPTVHRPVRCRGADETPLPPVFQSMDIWNVRSKEVQVDTTRGGGLDVPSPRDAGALRFSQVSVLRLQASKSFAESRQAEVRRSMQRAKGSVVFDDSDVPEYGSDIAEDDNDAASVVTGYSALTADGRPRRRRHPPGPIVKVAGIVPGIACQTTEEDLPNPEDQLEFEESRARLAAEATETRRLLLTGNGGKTRDQMLEDALKSAEVAIQLLKPRPIGATLLSEPDSPHTYNDGGAQDTVEAAWRPFGRGPEPYSRSTSFAAVVPLGGVVAPGGGGGGAAQPMPGRQQDGSSSAAAKSSRGGGEMYGKGPEPFSLEKLNAEPSYVSDHEAMAADIPKTNASSFGGVSIGVGGLVDYETAMARRRAIAGAEVAADRSSVLSKTEVLNLFVTYCNLGGHPELIEMLQKAIDAPVSTVTVTAVAKAAVATNRNANTSRADVDSEATKQRIRGTAWLLGVTWRRISNETYSSFLSRVLGFPGDLTTSLHRTKATQLIARALVRGHDFAAVPRAPRH